MVRCTATPCNHELSTSCSISNETQITSSACAPQKSPLLACTVFTSTPAHRRQYIPLKPPGHNTKQPSHRPHLKCQDVRGRDNQRLEGHEGAGCNQGRLRDLWIHCSEQHGAGDSNHPVVKGSACGLPVAVGGMECDGAHAYACSCTCPSECVLWQRLVICAACGCSSSSTEHSVKATRRLIDVYMGM